jgi:acyl carrier protein
MTWCPLFVHCTTLHRAPGGRESITLHSTVERDLGLDRLARAEVLLRLEQHFSVQLPGNTLGSVETMADLVNGLIGAGVQAGAS